MAQPKKSSQRSSRSSPAKRSATSRPGSSRPAAARSPSARPRRSSPPPPPEPESLVAQGVGTLRDTLARAADSLNLVVLSRDRLHAAVDDAVSRGHITRDAANGLVADLVRRGRQELEDVLADGDQLLGRVRGAVGADVALAQVDRARRAVGVGPTFPILGYDDLTAAQITGRLDALSPAELRTVREYERRHGNRKSVLAAVEKRLNA